MKTKEFKTTILDRLNKVYNKKTSIAVCLYAHISGGSISVYDPQNNRISLTLSNPVFSGLECAVSFEQLYKIFGKLKDMEFSFVQSSGMLEIETAKGKFKIESYETDPGLNIEIGNNNRTIGQFSPGSIELLKKGLKYVSNDDLRPVMCGIFIDSEKRKVVASDAHRLCFYELNDSINESFILPAIVAEVFNKDESFEISFDGKYLTFEAENFKLVCNEIEGKYPNWSAVVPKQFTQEHKIKSADLLEALELAKITGNSVSQLVKFSFTETGLNLSSSDLDFNTSFESLLPLESELGFITIGFKNDFLQSIIKTERTEFLTIQTTDPSRAALINGNLILMPMMIEA